MGRQKNGSIFALRSCGSHWFERRCGKEVGRACPQRAANRVETQPARSGQTRPTFSLHSGLGGDGLAFFAPAFTEGGEGLGGEESAGEGEDDALFFVEVFARGEHGAEEQSARVGDAADFGDRGEVGVDLLVFGVEVFVLAELDEIGFEGFHQEVVFDARVDFEEGFEEGGEGADFRNGSQFGRGLLDVIEDVVKDDVLGGQSLNDGHRVVGRFDPEVAWGVRD